MNWHIDVTISVLPVGHTWFAPDWCFGLLKRGYRRTNIENLASTAQVVNNSAGCNVAQLVSCEDGRIIVPTYDLAGFFATHLKKISGIKKFVSWINLNIGTRHHIEKMTSSTTPTSHDVRGHKRPMAVRIAVAHIIIIA